MAKIYSTLQNNNKTSPLLLGGVFLTHQVFLKKSSCNFLSKYSSFACHIGWWAPIPTMMFLLCNRPTRETGHVLAGCHTSRRSSSSPTSHHLSHTYHHLRRSATSSSPHHTIYTHHCLHCKFSDVMSPSVACGSDGASLPHRTITLPDTAGFQPPPNLPLYLPGMKTRPQQSRNPKLMTLTILLHHIGQRCSHLRAAPPLQQPRLRPLSPPHGPTHNPGRLGLMCTGRVLLAQPSPYKLWQACCN
jgi:hypothetical protein